MTEKRRRPRGELIPLGGGSYRIRVQTRERGPTGRFRAHCETIHNTTEAQARRRRRELLARVEAGVHFRPAPLTIAALIDEWLEQKRREGRRRATLYTYSDAANSYLKPYVGRLRLKELTPVAVRNLFNTLQDRGLSTATIRYARAVLNLAARAAITWGYLKENPVANIPAPKGAEGRVAHCLNVEEARALVEAAVSEPEDLVFAFALLTGLRPEEYLGLKRRYLELDSERGLVLVRQVAVKVRGGGWEFPPPKTRKGLRDVPIPAWLCRELKRLELFVDSRRCATGEG
jgi:integrase